MSVVTDVILTFSIMEPRERLVEVRLVEVNAFFDPDTTPLLDVSEHGGGTKAHQVVIATGAFNYLDHQAFLAHVARVPWTRPASVRVFMQFEHRDAVEQMAIPWPDRQPALPSPTPVDPDQGPGT